MTNAAPARLSFSVPLPPNVSNKSHKNLYVNVRRKREYWRLLELRLHARLLPKPPWGDKPPARMRVRWRWFVWGIMDENNLYDRSKMLIDWLVAWDFLPGDKPAVLEYEHPPAQTLDRRNPRVEIIIEEIV